MGELKTVDEIDLDYSKSQIYWRIKKLVENDLMNPPERGDRNQYLLGQEDVKLLRRLQELEADHDSVGNAIETLKEKGGEEEGDDIRRRVENLEEKTEFLKVRINDLEDRLAKESDRTEQFRKKWGDQLRQGAKKVREFFE